MNIQIRKCHGSGNDFLLIDEMSSQYHFSEKDRQNLAIALCDRKSLLGADGILFTMNSDHADAKMRVFNADGSEASMCGNGLRCVGRYVCELLQKDEIAIETMKATLLVSKAEPIFNEIPTYCVEISPVLFSLSALPMNMDKNHLINEKIVELSDQLLFSAVAVPNPHLISFVDKDVLRANTQETIAKYVNGPNPLFPDGVNVSFVKELEKGEIFVRTYERGVGFTNACGTAMSSSSLISCLLSMNEFESSIEVYNNGGKVRCVVHKLEDQYKIDLIGNATYIYDAEIKLDRLNPELFQLIHKSSFDEQKYYEELETYANKRIEKVLLG
ncbi:diaminopimelate epimerase [Heyndrickxia sporothermodurans]|uniref:diaminopimelate epimerase n=1 Tax=Heyndrickxia TaxID=2837504 RepID=UPI000D35DDEE|nr:diaminopimelate epimerase [Heyndrickxia sporothermodurans]PTY78777.1 diaminopimelate epimerase [Heyndrickxia sporothermodurans]